MVKIAEFANLDNFSHEEIYISVYHDQENGGLFLTYPDGTTENMHNPHVKTIEDAEMSAHGLYMLLYFMNGWSYCKTN